MKYTIEVAIEPKLYENHHCTFVQMVDELKNIIISKRTFRGEYETELYVRGLTAALTCAGISFSVNTHWHENGIKWFQPK